MKYYLDTEFIEGFHKPLFGKRRHFIDLISIGIIAEDGREYYAISNEYKYTDADEWVRENVILPIYRDEIAGLKRHDIMIDKFHKCIPNGKSNKQIAEEVIKFCSSAQIVSNPPVFYGYYSDYDWVLFCSLFGTMMELPKGFPMYCRDLKQMLDESEKVKNFDVLKLTPARLFNGAVSEADCRNIKLHPQYPKQENEHNALNDAKWNKKLHEFILSIP